MDGVATIFILKEDWVVLNSDRIHNEKSISIFYLLVTNNKKQERNFKFDFNEQVH
jgi:hypothetical protein